MTITTSFLPGGAAIGPGLSVLLNTSTSGPYPIDDYWAGTVSDHATSELLVQFITVNRFSSPSVNCVIGSIDATAFSNSQPRVRFFVAPGSACDLNVSYHHASGSFVDGPTTFPGFTWDPTSGLYLLLLEPSVGGLDAQILAAVKTIFPATH